VAATITQITGSKWAFLAACGAILTWAATGPFLGFSAMWQLVINTGTSILTFLMVFLIQNTQNRESKAIHIKLDELLYAVQRAHNEIINIEDLDEEQLDRLRLRYQKIAEQYHPATEAELARRVGAVSAQVGEIKHDVEEVAERVKHVEGKVGSVDSKVNKTRCVPDQQRQSHEPATSPEEHHG
jgi:low affinity Fe/Cu permease